METNKKLNKNIFDNANIDNIFDDDDNEVKQNSKSIDKLNKEIDKISLNDENNDKTKDNFEKQKKEYKIPLKTKNFYKKDDFEIVALSGKGAYGTVLKVKLKNGLDNKLYAIKIMDIVAMSKINKLYQAYLECDILSQLNSPYIVNILGSFIENNKIYIVMDYLSKGDFSDFIRLNFPLKPETIQFYVAEIVQFLSYIQSKNIVHRDLKPENIMMNEKWHLQVIDFATARILGKYFDKEKMEFKNDDTYYDLTETDDLKGNKIAIDIVDDDLDGFQERQEKRGMTFVGTAEYVSPEVLGDTPAGFGADIWALGIMIYQMYYGKTPFKDKTNYLIFRNIENTKIEFPPNQNISEQAKDLIKKILIKEPNQRLGAGEKGTKFDIENLKAHPYFKGIDWENLHNIPPPNNEKFDYLLSKKNPEKLIQKENPNLTKKIIQNDESNKHVNSEQEIVLRKGYLDKKSPWLHYNKRKIILYSTPKLSYIDPTNNKVKGEIFLDKTVKIIHVNENAFDLITQSRSYKFKTTDGNALIWEKSISDAIKQYGK